MKKSLPIIIIIVVAALTAVFRVKIDESLTKKAHPLRYTELVEKYSREYAVPETLIYAVIKNESSFKSDALSPKGATGLMQIMPETFVWLCEKNSDTDNNPDVLYNPEINIKYGVYYLGLLYSEFESWETALAAYNAGPSRVRSWLEDESISENGVLVNIPYEETKEYIEKVMKSKEIYTELYFEENA